MAINGIQPVGDDQRWKQEVESQLRELKQLVSVLQAQLNARSR